MVVAQGLPIGGGKGQAAPIGIRRACQVGGQVESQDERPRAARRLVDGEALLQA